MWMKALARGAGSALAKLLTLVLLVAQGQAMGAPGERVYITEAGGYRHARQHQSDLDARLSLHAA
jgi:hypothetical protein